MVLRPGFEGVALGPLLALIASLVWGVALLTIKVLARTESSLTITAYMMILLTPISLIPAVFFWQWPTGEQYKTSPRRPLRAPEGAKTKGGLS